MQKSKGNNHASEVKPHTATVVTLFQPKAKPSVTQVTGLHSPRQRNPTATLAPGLTFHSTLMDSALPHGWRCDTHIYCILMDNVL